MFKRLDNLSSSGVLQFSNGYAFLGDTYDGQYLDNENNVLPEDSYTGTSESRGNVKRSLYNINTNGPLIFNQTADDNKQIVSNYPDIVTAFPILTTFPYLYPASEGSSARSQTSLDFSKEFPIYKCLGKGLGEVHFFKTASNIDNDTSLYPYDGYIYAGTLVQLVTENGETRVIPYQSGRGIPEYSTNYLPQDVTPITNFAPFGQLVDPSDNPIEPTLAPGITPGESNTCLGIVLDSYTSTDPKRRMFRLNQPTGFTSEQLENDNHEKWFNKPAPHAVQAVSFKTNLTTPDTQGFLSPGPNLGGSYYAPWPRYYAYQSSDAIPILTKGITTARIGAAYSIAQMTYGVRKQISATDESWVPVPIIPLFQGEKIEAGSYIYAAVKGNIMSPGAYYPASQGDTQIFGNSLIRGTIGQSPWDIFVDATWGNIGWTGTPALSFSNIPDQGINILETLNGETLPYLNQANQGSIIVHPISTTGPSPSLGNNYLTSQTALDNFQEGPITEAQAYQIQQDRYLLPGISGRGMLPQTVPEKAQPIGIMLETITGTGKWTYTAARSDANYDETINIVSGGADYRSPTTLPTINPLGAGTGLTISWANNEENPPSLGTILEPITIVAPGVGYLDNDTLIITDDTLTYSSITQYKGYNAGLIYDSTGPTVTLFAGGRGYASNDTDMLSFNLSLNNGYFNFTANSSVSSNDLPAGTNYYQNFTKYPIGTTIRVIEGGIVYNDSAFFVFDTESPSFTTTNLTLLQAGTGYFAQGPAYFETEIMNYQYAPASFDVVTVDDSIFAGNLTSVSFSDYGAGNQVGDKLLIIGDGLDPQFALVEFPGLAPGQQEIIYFSPNYDVGLYNTYRQQTTIDDGLLIDVVAIDQPYLDETSMYMPIVTTENTAGSALPTENYLLYYTGAFQVIESPWYHNRRFTVNYDVNGIFPIRGGTNYEAGIVGGLPVGINLSTYNLTANSLRLQFSVVNEVVTNIVTTHMRATDVNYNFVESRYTFDPISGTQVDLLYDSANSTLKRVRLDNISTDDITVTTITEGGLYPGLADGDYVFQTQRTDQVNPTVDIVTGGFPIERVQKVKLNTLGSGNQNGDIILILQEGSDQNCFFIFNDNMPTIDLPPYAVPDPNYKVETDDAAWQRYSDIMESATNLLDKQVLIELRQTNEQSQENILPFGFLGSGSDPSQANLYRNFYREI